MPPSKSENTLGLSLSWGLQLNTTRMSSWLTQLKMVISPSAEPLMAK